MYNMGISPSLYGCVKEAPNPVAMALFSITNSFSQHVSLKIALDINSSMKCSKAGAQAED